MVVDTSALIAILKQEDESPSFSRAIRDADILLVSAATVVEAGIVIEHHYGEGGARDLDSLLAEAQFEIVPATVDHARLAREGFSRFGKGRHPARLNFGDCFSYALAKATGQALLFKGNDFSQTDISVALS